MIKARDGGEDTNVETIKKHKHGTRWNASDGDEGGKRQKSQMLRVEECFQNDVATLREGEREKGW